MDCLRNKIEQWMTGPNGLYYPGHMVLSDPIYNQWIIAYVIKIRIIHEGKKKHPIVSFRYYKATQKYECRLFWTPSNLEKEKHCYHYMSTDRNELFDNFLKNIGELRCQGKRNY